MTFFIHNYIYEHRIFALLSQKAILKSLAITASMERAELVPHH